MNKTFKSMRNLNRWLYLKERVLPIQGISANMLTYVIKIDKIYCKRNVNIKKIYSDF